MAPRSGLVSTSGVSPPICCVDLRRIRPSSGTPILLRGLLQTWLRCHQIRREQRHRRAALSGFSSWGRAAAGGRRWACGRRRACGRPRPESRRRRVSHGSVAAVAVAGVSSYLLFAGCGVSVQVRRCTTRGGRFRIVPHT